MFYIFNYLDKINSHKFRFLLNTISIILIFISLYGLKNNVYILPSIDEHYHFTKKLVDRDLNFINPFDKKYEFLGHPPGYPISLYLMFNFTDLNYIAAHYHALFFSFLFLIVFYKFCSLHLTWIFSIALTLTISKNYFFKELASQCLADIPTLFFLFLSLIFLKQKKYKLLMTSTIILVMFRESGIALPIAVLMYALLFKPEDKKNLIISCLPSIILLILFFAINFYYFGLLSRHPYAMGTLQHNDFEFFEFNMGKIQAIKYCLSWIYESMPYYTFLLSLFGLYIFFKNKFKDRNLVIFLLTALFITLFFISYADVIYRDFLITYIAGYFFAFYGINKISNNLNGMICASIILFINITNPPRAINNLEYSLINKETANFLIENYENKKICVIEPLFHLTHPIYGYFPANHKLIFNCKDPDVLGGREKSYNQAKMIESFNRVLSGANYKKTHYIGNSLFGYQLFEKY